MPDDPQHKTTRGWEPAGLLVAAVAMIALLVSFEGFRLSGPLIGLLVLGFVAGFKAERWRMGA